MSLVFVHGSDARYGSMVTGVPAGTVAKRSSIVVSSRATQPRVQSPSVPPPWTKMSPPRAASLGGFPAC